MQLERNFVEANDSLWPFILIGIPDHAMLCDTKRLVIDMKKASDLLHDQARAGYKFQLLECLVEIFLVEDLFWERLRETLNLNSTLLRQSCCHLEERSVYRECLHYVATVSL